MGDTIQIDNERMLVAHRHPAGAGVWNLAVTRAYNSSTQDHHAAKAPVLQITADATAVDPSCTRSALRAKTLPDIVPGGTSPITAASASVSPSTACTNADLQVGRSGDERRRDTSPALTGTIAATGTNLTITAAAEQRSSRATTS